MTKLNHYIQNTHSGRKPKKLVVLLHGYGSNGRDLISLTPYWESAIPETLFASPDAPFPCEMGGSGFQWFSLQDRTPEKMLEGVQKAAPILNEYIDDQLEEYDLTDKDLFLVGFSQGTMMSLYTGPRRQKQIAGILGYSGALIGKDGLNTHNKPPIHLIHGEADEVVPVTAYHHAHKTLVEKGFSITGHTTPNLSHSIDNKGITSGSDFLSKYS